MDHSDTAFLRLLEVHRAEYRRELPGRVEALLGGWRDFQRRNGPADALEELVRSAHRLAGSGATFGLAGVSRAARELERHMEALQGAGRDDGALMASVAAGIEALAAEARAARP